MNHVERFRALMAFQPVDRLPRVEWAPWWDKTLDRWHGEGLPADLQEPLAVARWLGLDPYKQVEWLRPFAPDFPWPQPGPAVRTAEDYLRLRAWLYPDLSGEIESLCPWAESQARGEVVLWMTLDGFFWFPRTLLGIEGHLYAFYDRPDLLRRINEDLADWYERLVPAVLAACRPVFLTFAEDMSYNHGPMLSRAMFEAFLAPYYRRVAPILRDAGVPAIVDSDGDVTEMVPWLQAVGIEGVLPLERQAGVDGPALRRRHPHLLMVGHYDKMAMTRGEAAMRTEFERLRPLMRTGGFLPAVDHQTPPGVSLAEYRLYLRLLEEYTAAP
jgi:hypothetical protein